MKKIDETHLVKQVKIFGKTVYQMGMTTSRFEEDEEVVDCMHDQHVFDVKIPRKRATSTR